MNKAQLSLLEQRAKRLEQAAQLLWSEAKVLHQEIESAGLSLMLEAIPSVNDGLSDQERQNMIVEAVGVQATLAQPKTFPIGEWIFGEDGLLAKYFSKEVFHRGKGVFKPSEVLKVYEEDVFWPSVGTLMLWPGGFYRDRKDSSLQLLLRSADRNFMLIVGGLPGSESSVSPRAVLYTNLVTPGQEVLSFRINHEKETVMSGEADKTESWVKLALAEVEQLIKCLYEVALSKAA